MGHIIRRSAVAVLIAVATATTASAATAPPRGVVYAGAHSQDAPIVIVVNPTLTKVKTLRFEWDAACTAGPAATPQTELGDKSWVETLTNFPIKNGKWGESWTTQPFNDAGVLRTYQYNIAGKRSGGYMVGNIAMAMREVTPAGDLVRSCVAKPLTFKVKDRDTFGGGTSKRFPIAISMNATRRQVKRVDWAWEATCTAGPAVRPDTSLSFLFVDTFTNLAVSAAGTFGGTYRYEPVVDTAAGSARNWTYTVTGKRSGRLIKGKLAVSFDDVDASGGPLHGQIIRHCTSGSDAYTIQD